MFHKELLFLGSIVIAVFLGVAAISWYAVRSLQQNATMVVRDTLPGLVDAGGAISRMHENWLLIHLVAQKTDAANRAALISQIHTNSTEGLWQDYGRSIFSEEDRRGYEALTDARKAFIERRNQLLKLLENGKQAEANEMMENELEPLYSRYEAAARALFVFNARVGQERGTDVINHARFAPAAISALCVSLFVFGILVGWHFAWSGPELLSRIQKK